MKNLFKKLARLIAPVTADEIAALIIAEAERMKLVVGPGYAVDVVVQGKASWETPNVPGFLYASEAVFTIYAFELKRGDCDFKCKTGEGRTLCDAFVKLEEELRRR